MGYTTKFKGEFIITPYPTEEFVETINIFSSKRHDEEMIYIKGNNVKQICGCYDVNENELILSVTIDANGKVEKEIL